MMKLPNLKDILQGDFQIKFAEENFVHK